MGLFGGKKEKYNAKTLSKPKQIALGVTIGAVIILVAIMFGGNSKSVLSPKELDNEVWSTFSLSEKANEELQISMQQVANGEITDLDFYNVCKNTDKLQSQYYLDYPAYDKESEAYVRAGEEYSTNVGLIAESLVKYIDKNEIKYLSKAQEYSERTGDFKLNVINSRMQFLQDSGFTQDEIDNIIKNN